jgi:hypothetical protein
MKRIILFFVTSLFLSCVAMAQYQSANKPVELDYKKLDEQVGKEYWIKANPNAILRKKFREVVWNGWGNDFVVTEDLKFTVIGWELAHPKMPSLKVQFEDGKQAYINVSMWQHNKDVLDDVFDGSQYYDFSEYFFKENPNAALAEWKKRKAQAEAAHKAKGGVRVGMTKAEVLKSNWGKPESVNKTTNASGVREQWVYGGRNYLYFRNGILTSIQN